MNAPSHLNKLSFLIVLLAFLGCKTTQPTVSVVQNTSNKEEAAEGQTISTANGPYNPSETRFHDLVHTKLDLSFDWNKQYVNGLATLTLTPYFYQQDSLYIDAKGFDIHSVKLVSDTLRKDLAYDYDQKLIKVKLDKSYTRKDTFNIEVDYTAKPNELPVGGSEAIQKDKGLYFINPLGKEPFKPKQIWTQGETEASSKWFPTIDSPNERTTQEMYLTVDTSYTVLTNGELVYSLENGDGTKTDYWKMDKPHAPYLFMLAIGDFAVVKDSWKGKEVNYYVEPRFKESAKLVFGNTPEMLSFFSEKLDYPYPWNKYSQVVVRDFVSGAMENTTASIFMEGLQIDEREVLDVNWDYIIAHELFHHWFGDLVTCESWANLPLNEAFANYSEYLWAEHKYGLDEADYHGEKELAEYLQEAQEKQEPLIRYNYLDKEDMFDRHSYNKGGRVLHMLRNHVGDEAFFESLSLYLKKNEYKPVEIHNLRLAFEEVTGQDLNWFFNQWFLSPGHPELKVEDTYNNGVLSLKVWQNQDTSRSPVYRLPLKVAVFSKGKKNVFDIDIKEQYQEFSFPVETTPDLVLLDSEFILLGEASHEKSKEELAFQFRNSERYLGRKAALNSLVEVTSQDSVSLFEDPLVRKVISEALNDEFWAIREAAVNLFFQYPVSNMAYYINDIEEIAKGDSKPSVRADAIYVLSRTYNEEYTQVYKDALKAKPYSVVAAGLSSYLKTGDSSITVNYKEYENTENLEVSLALANHYLSDAVEGKYGWFEEKMIRFKNKPRELYNMLFFFGAYLQGLEGSEVENGKKILVEIKNDTNYEVIKALCGKYINSLKETE